MEDLTTHGIRRRRAVFRRRGGCDRCPPAVAAAATVRAASVIAGHFGFAAMVKARERQAPLWALMLASVWLDVVFVPLYLTGIETLVRAPGTHGSYGAGIIYADYTHSLVGA